MCISGRGGHIFIKGPGPGGDILIKGPGSERVNWSVNRAGQYGGEI